MQSTAIIDAVKGVTKDWAKQRKREEREQNAYYRRHDALTSPQRVTIRDAAWEVMEEAYLKASSRNTLPALARQIMYAARETIQERTDRTLDDQYFTQTLLPDYLKEHPAETVDWDVVFDARGHFEEPHTRKNVPLGTLQVRNYLSEVTHHAVGDIELEVKGGRGYPTCGPEHRFGAVLFIEKEGFMPLFKKVRLAERYDLAIMSTKGLSVTASRHLVDQFVASTRSPCLCCMISTRRGFRYWGPFSAIRDATNLSTTSR